MAVLMPVGGERLALKAKEMAFSGQCRLSD
jgi:hypothetical protein